MAFFKQKTSSSQASNAQLIQLKAENERLRSKLNSVRKTVNTYRKYVDGCNESERESLPKKIADDLVIMAAKHQEKGLSDETTEYLIQSEVAESTRRLAELNKSVDESRAHLFEQLVSLLENHLSS